MRAVVLMDNISNDPALTAQWGCPFTLNIKATFPGRKVHAIIGDLHLFHTPADQV